MVCTQIKLWTCKGFKPHRPSNRCGNSVVIFREYNCDSLCRHCKDGKFKFEKRLRDFEDFDLKTLLNLSPTIQRLICKNMKLFQNIGVVIYFLSLIAYDSA